MTDFINKIIMIILVVLLLFIAPLNMKGMTRRAMQKVQVMNSVELFLDTVCDKGYVQKNDIDDLNRKIAATGMIITIEIEEYKMLAEFDKVTLAKTCNIDYKRVEASADKYEIDATNVIRVTVKESVVSGEAKLWYRIIGSLDKYEDSLSRMRR